MAIGYFISPDSEAFSNIAKEAYDYFDTNAITEISKDAESVKAAARHFLNAYKDFQRYELDYQKQKAQNKALAASGSPVITVGADLINNRNLSLKNISIAAEVFAEAVNKFIGQELQTILVYEYKGKPHLLAVDATEYKELFSVLFGGVKFDFTIRQLKKLKNSKELTQRLLTEHQTKFKNQLNESNLNKTYSEILHRYNKYTGKQTTQKKKKDSSGKIILKDVTTLVHIIIWRTGGGGDWRVMLMGNKGDIREAYVAIMFDANRTFNFIQGNIDNFIDHYVPYIQEVDSTRGRLKGDVSARGLTLNKESSGMTELAVKSQTASTMALNSIVEMAQRIVNSKATTDEGLKKILQKMRNTDIKGGQTRNKVYTLKSGTSIERQIADMTNKRVLEETDKELLGSLKAQLNSGIADII